MYPNTSASVSDEMNDVNTTEKRYPSFMIVGAGKCGTSTIAAMLDMHTRIVGSVIIFRYLSIDIFRYYHVQSSPVFGTRISIEIDQLSDFCIYCMEILR